MSQDLDSSETVRMFVNGEGMSGRPLNGPLLAEGAFRGPAFTAARYRFFSVRDEFPGLHPVAAGGAQVPGEIWEVSYAVLRERFMPFEPAELELGLVEMSDGSGALSMRMRADALDAPGVVDISNAGGWLAYRAAAQK